MKKYHLTVSINGQIKTIFTEVTSIEAFILVSNEQGNICNILYCRELNEEEWFRAKQLNLYIGGHQPMN